MRAFISTSGGVSKPRGGGLAAGAVPPAPAPPTEGVTPAGPLSGGVGGVGGGGGGETSSRADDTAKYVLTFPLTTSTTPRTTVAAGGVRSEAPAAAGGWKEPRTQQDGTGRGTCSGRSPPGVARRNGPEELPSAPGEHQQQQPSEATSTGMSSAEAAMQWRRIQQEHMAPPKCKGHGETCKVRKVKEGQNLGRVFFCCPRPAGKMIDGGDCGFFKWAYGRNQK